METTQLLDFLKKTYKKETFKAAIVGTYKDGRYVDPPNLQLSYHLLLAPMFLSVFVIAAVKNMWAQWLIGVALITASYLAIYTYLRGKCFTPDEIRVVKTNYGDLDYLKRNKVKILENLHDAPGDYEIYYPPERICVISDRKANAFTLSGPKGPVIYLTTGLFARLGTDEIQAVLEHERGHIKHRHTEKLLAFLIAEYTLRLPLVHLVYAKYSILLLAIHLLGVALLFTAVLQAFEFEADRYAARKNREKLVSALVKLDWNGIVETLANPIATRLTLLARTHPLTLDRLKKLDAIPH